MSEFLHNQRGRVSSVRKPGRASWRIGLVVMVAAVVVPMLSASSADADPVAPSAPTAVAAVGATGQATVTWTVGADGGDPITAFVITPYIDGTAGPSTTYPAGANLDPTPGSVDSTVFSPLPSATGYTFAVAETNAIGTGPLSAQSNSVSSEAPVAGPVLISVAPTSNDFGDITLGDISNDQTFTFTNAGTSNEQISGLTYAGNGADDFVLTARSDCEGAEIEPGSSCTVTFAFLPGATGVRNATITADDGASNPAVISLTGTGTEGYYVSSANGTVEGLGDAYLAGQPSSKRAVAPIVSVASTGDDGGYWQVDALGNVYDNGDAQNYGDVGGRTLNHPIVGIAATPDFGGYWLVASDVGIFSYGDAMFYGSTGAIKLNKPIVGMTPTPDGAGYWLVASDGGIFAYGDAQFYGSTGGIKLNKPVVGMASTPDGAGYWLVASDGGIFAYGDAKFYGSTGGIKLNQLIVGMAASPNGGGYWMVASDGGIFTFGNALFEGSASGVLTNVVGMSITGASTFQSSVDIPAVRWGAADPSARQHRVQK